VSAKSPSSAAVVITDAMRRARAEGVNEIRAEHLFAALLGQPDARPLFGKLAGAAGAEAVWNEVLEARRHGGMSTNDREALADLGIDLDEVVAHAEAQLGEGALDSSRGAGAPGRKLSMSPEATGMLNAAQRQKVARGDRDLTAQHLVLGLLAQPGPFADALKARGITVASTLAAMDNGAGSPSPDA
jgi:ATP-dependent Clp protease ATP-binding subunit ClpA